MVLGTRPEDKMLVENIAQCRADDAYLSFAVRPEVYSHCDQVVDARVGPLIQKQRR